MQVGSKMKRRQGDTMKHNAAIPFIIKQFRKQRERMKRLILAFAFLLILVMAIPLVAKLFPVLRNNTAWDVIMIVWGCLLGISFLLVTFASLFNQICPGCGKSIGEDFWAARYCQHCGAKLREN